MAQMHSLFLHHLVSEGDIVLGKNVTGMNPFYPPAHPEAEAVPFPFYRRRN